MTELMRKIYGNVTTRSNVFAVWCTVGYFRVDMTPGLPPGDTVRPVRLAEELGAATNTNIRQRFFSVIDRSRLVIAPSVTTLSPNNNVQVLNQPITIQVAALNGTVPANTAPWYNTVGIPWQIPGIVQPTAASGQPPFPVPGSPTTLVIDNGTPSEETVVVSTPTPNPNLPPNNGNQPVFWMTATFHKLHNNGAPLTIPGNPGPQPRFTVNDPSYAGIVAAYGILE